MIDQNTTLKKSMPLMKNSCKGHARPVTQLCKYPLDEWKNDPGAPRNNQTVQHHYRPNKIRIVSRCIIWLRWRRPEVRSGGCPGAPDAPKTCRCRESADAPPDGLCARTARTLPHLITSLCSSLCSSPRSVSVCLLCIEEIFYLEETFSCGDFRAPQQIFPSRSSFVEVFCVE